MKKVNRCLAGSQLGAPATSMSKRTLTAALEAADLQAAVAAFSPGHRIPFAYPKRSS
jgi:hypothetical protein